MNSSMISLDAIENNVQTTTKGYAFLSYPSQDRDFIGRLKDELRKNGYAYWDYKENDRDYYGALYRELENKIENAAAFFTIVSDAWRDSEWIANEFFYAKEVQVPIFVIVAKQLIRPIPLPLKSQTHIDMSSNFDESCKILREELRKKGL